MKYVPRLQARFDGVLAHASLLHIPKKEAQAVIDGFVSVLKPGGYLCVEVKAMRESGPQEAVLNEKDYGYPYQRFFSYFSMGELEGYFKRAGLQILYTRDLPVKKTHWLLIIGRKN